MKILSLKIKTKILQLCNEKQNRQSHFEKRKTNKELLNVPFQKSYLETSCGSKDSLMPGSHVHLTECVDDMFAK